MEKAVRQKLNKPNGEITEEELLGIKDLHITNKKIRYLKGIEKLKNLEELNIGWNEIEDISCIASLSKLKEIIIYKNKIEDISPLRELNLSQNEITDYTSVKAYYDNLIYKDFEIN